MKDVDWRSRLRQFDAIVRDVFAGLDDFELRGQQYRHRADGEAAATVIANGRAVPFRRVSGARPRARVRIRCIGTWVVVNGCVQRGGRPERHRENNEDYQDSHSCQLTAYTGRTSSSFGAVGQCVCQRGAYAEAAGTARSVHFVSETSSGIRIVAYRNLSFIGPLPSFAAAKNPTKGGAMLKTSKVTKEVWQLPIRSFSPQEKVEVFGLFWRWALMTWKRAFL